MVHTNIHTQSSIAMLILVLYTEMNSLGSVDKNDTVEAFYVISVTTLKEQYIKS